MHFIIRFLKNFYYIFKFHKKSARQKTSLFFTYISLFFKEIIFVQLLKIPLKSSRIFGYRIFFFSHSQFLSLFEDEFINDEYCFRTNNQFPLIIDGGTHIGLEILFFKKIYPHCKIIAFEPDRKTFSLLKKTIAINRFDNITLVNKALSDKNGSARLYSDFADPGSTVMSLEKNRLYKNSTIVKTVRLSDYINKPVDFLKLDIEGAEIKVINDLTVKRKLAQIHQGIIEYHHHIKRNDDRLSDLLSSLEKYGFGYQISNKLRPPFNPNTYQDLLIYFYKK